MAKPGTIPHLPEKKPPRIPPLEAGDQLTRDEFERRYQAMPQVKKAELIEGEVYMPSPVRLDQHADPHADFMGWLVFFRAYTRGVRAAVNATIRLDLGNEPQPDGTLIILPEYGGQVEIDADGYIAGGPELVGEISASTASIDLNKKFRVYRHNKIREYIVWRVPDAALDWFVLREGQFERLPLSPDGFYKSEVFPGLWLDPEALIRGDMVTVLAVLQQGIASPEHGEFVRQLQQKYSPKSL